MGFEDREDFGSSGFGNIEVDGRFDIEDREDVGNWV